MFIEIRESEDTDWHVVGAWFTSFVELGEKIHSAHLAGNGYKRVLISIPRSDLVAIALAIGFSLAS